MTETGADGALSAWALLRNVDLFADRSATAVDAGGSHRAVDSCGPAIGAGGLPPFVALAGCRAYLAEARRYPPFHPHCVREHMLALLRPLVAPATRKNGESRAGKTAGHDGHRDIWVAM
jgi:hypothetical protein